MLFIAGKLVFLTAPTCSLPGQLFEISHRLNNLATYEEKLKRKADAGIFFFFWVVFTTFCGQVQRVITNLGPNAIGTLKIEAFRTMGLLPSRDLDRDLAFM